MAVVYRPRNYPHGKSVDLYYRHAANEPFAPGHNLPVERVVTFNDNFLDLVQAIHGDRTKDVILVTHGNSWQGITLPIGPSTDVAVGAVMHELVGLVRNNGAYTEDYCAQNWSLPKPHVQALVATCRAIRSNSNVAFGFHVRGCDVGASTDNLSLIYSLFKDESGQGPPRMVTAPNCGMAYIMVQPRVVPNLAGFVATHVPGGGRPPGATYHRRTFSVPPASAEPSVVVDLYKRGVDAGSYAAARSQAAVRDFARTVYFGHSPGSVHEFVVATMINVNDTYYLAHEKEYASRIERLSRYSLSYGPR